MGEGHPRSSDSTVSDTELEASMVPDTQPYARPEKQDKQADWTRYCNFIVCYSTVVALLLVAYTIYTGYKCVVGDESVYTNDADEYSPDGYPRDRDDYCLIYEDHFTTLDTSIWTHEVQLGGFGTNTFDWTTSDPSNAYITPDGLRITPTLTNETTTITNAQIENGYTLNLTADGTCTGTGESNCFLSSNSSIGRIINPVRSARLSTKGRKSIKYGRIEVTAQMPKGDWMWPAIWMLPEKDIYGPWPRSGEIDIVETRGNAKSYPVGGRDRYSSAIHWGPDSATNAYWRTTANSGPQKSDLSDGFHTYGIEWSEDYLFTYLDSRLHPVLTVSFKDRPLWEKGDFDTLVDYNGSHYQDPWGGTGRKNTPFDHPFCLVLNVAVGGTNGYFPEGEGGKPWANANASTNAMADFWRSAHQWLPTWPRQEDRGMTVSKVKMWQQGGCPGDSATTK